MLGYCQLWPPACELRACTWKWMSNAVDRLFFEKASFFWVVGGGAGGTNAC